MSGVQKHKSLEQKVTGFFQEYGLIPLRKPILVGVSGGPDSICLLHILNRLKKELKLKLHVAHLDHRLRKESAQDAQYVLDLCHEMGVPVTVERRDVQAYRKEHKLSLEEAAREVRYAFLADAAVSIGTDTVAIGHTLDDHIETVLLNILRGTGTRGLRGLLPISRIEASGHPLAVIRPLLEVSREDTVEYCRLHNLQPRTDTSNRSLAFTRNRVRLKLMPLLKTFNPNIVDSLQRLSRIASDDIAFMEKTAGELWSKIARQEDGAVLLKKKVFRDLPRSIKRLVLRQAVETVRHSLKDIEARHIEDMLELTTGPTGKSINLPFALVFEAAYDCYVLRSADEQPPHIFQQQLGQAYSLTVPGKVEIPGWRISGRIVKEKGSGNEFTEYLDADKAGTELTVRTRRPGDCFQPLGLGAEKKVGKFMIDAHIPRTWRANVPLVCDGEKVLWVVGYRIDERVKVTEKTKRTLRIGFERV
ncbi:MAG: tRNA lysidine(34) synthetase TilS [Dehalococcoidia bacterium]|nr:tRNA lysidine(34) synthetase TilS [Dehalococcoidia bacterium]